MIPQNFCTGSSTKLVPHFLVVTAPMERLEKLSKQVPSDDLFAERVAENEGFH